MSTDRYAAALAKLEPAHTFPKTMYERYWSHLSGAALELLALVKLNDDGRRVALLSSADAQARLLAMLQSRDRRLFELELSEVLGSLAELKATYADDGPLTEVLDAVRGAVAQYHLDKSRIAHVNSANAKQANEEARARKARYVSIARSVIAMNIAAGTARVAAFNAECRKAKPPLTIPTKQSRANYFKEAEK